MTELQSEQSGRGARLESLPAEFQSLFWDHDFDKLDPLVHTDFIIGRILAAGPWKAVCWLRERLDDETLRTWIERHEGRPLSPQQLRFWELILNLPRRKVDRWLRQRMNNQWDDRIVR